MTTWVPGKDEGDEQVQGHGGGGDPRVVWALDTVL